MTNEQRWIRLYVSQRSVLDSVKLQNIGTNSLQITDRIGDTIRFTTNLFGDIMDADTKEIIAESNVSHDLDGLKKHPWQTPTAWTDNYRYFSK